MRFNQMEKSNKHILQNFSFCVAQKKSPMGLEQHKGEYVMTEYLFCLNYPFKTFHSVTAFIPHSCIKPRTSI